MSEPIPRRSTFIDFLRDHPSTKNFTVPELNRLYEMIEWETLSGGAVVVEEGGSSRDLYFILEGEVVLLRWNKEKTNQFPLGNLFKGEILGELSFLDAEPRAVTVKAVVPSILLRLPNEKVSSSAPGVQEIYDKLVRNIAFVTMRRLGQTTQNYTKSLRKQIEQLNFQNRSGRFFIICMVLMGLAGVVDTLTLKYGVNQSTPLYAWGYLLAVFIPLIVLMPYSGISLDEAGVTWKNAKPSLVEGAILVGVFVGLLAAGYWCYERLHPSAPSLSFLLQRRVHAISMGSLLLSVGYVYLQEFVVRGVIQGSLKKFWFSTSYAAPKAIFLASFMFAVSQVQWGFESWLIIFFSSLILGFLYDRHQNLLGVSLVHCVMNLLGITVLGTI